MRREGWHIRGRRGVGLGVGVEDGGGGVEVATLRRGCLPRRKDWRGVASGDPMPQGFRREGVGFHAYRRENKSNYFVDVLTATASTVATAHDA